MLNFQIQSDSDVPASKQLFAQIQFAIASGQYPPAHRLPSTRQLAMITGLHRNTISKGLSTARRKWLSRIYRWFGYLRQAARARKSGR